MSNTHGIFVDYPEPHLERMREILAKHPEAKNLVGPKSVTQYAVYGIVALQIVLAIALRNSPLWLIVLAAYTVGSVANHALWVLIHECTHNLVFKKAKYNILLQILANIPIIFPTAISFRNYHLKHHLYQGDLTIDADLPRPFEAKFIGNSSIRKALWMMFFFVSQLIRVPFLRGVEIWNRWVALNWVVEIAFLVALTSFAGWNALIYIGLCSVFSIGLHPLGARWIQEHYVVQPNQETYSYYGPLNKIAFNVGYHNEHHDLMGIAWINLPKLRAMAPEFYDTLYWHRSWSGLLWRFITDPGLTLATRVTRTKPDTAQSKVWRKAPTVDFTPQVAQSITT